MTTVQRKLTSLAALVVLGGAGAALVVWQDQHSESAAKEEAAGKKVLSFSDAKAIRELVLTTRDTTYTLVREGAADGTSTWRLTTPIVTSADGVIADGVVSALLELSRTQSIGDQGEKLDAALFGLEPARYTVTVTDATGTRETIKVGKKNSFDGSLYVQKVGESKVGLVAGSLEYQLDKDLFKLRDKRLVTFADREVRRVGTTLAGKPAYLLEKDGETWRLHAPMATLADSVQVSALVAALTGTSATSFVSETGSAAELATYGLTSPTAKVELGLDSGKVVTVLVTKGKGSAYYAAVAGGGPILELSSDWLLGKVRMPADELRDKHVLPFDRAQVGTLTITKGAESVAFARQEREGGGDDWVMTKPEAADAQDATIAALVYRLWNLKAQRIAAESLSTKDESDKGLSAPVLTIALGKKDGGALGTIRFGSSRADGTYVSAGVRLDVVEKGFVDETSVKIEDYKEADTTAQK
jgi:hypothetical protein